LTLLLAGGIFLDVIAEVIGNGEDAQFQNYIHAGKHEFRGGNLH
jgi:hypothetical protein